MVKRVTIKHNWSRHVFYKFEMEIRTEDPNLDIEVEMITIQGFWYNLWYVTEQAVLEDSKDTITPYSFVCG